jgi:hypothetical protein
MSYAGIDYGLGTTNINKETSIRYGVIHQNEVLQAWADSSEPNYPDEGESECPECGAMYEGKTGESVTCECGEEFEIELNEYIEPYGYSVVSEECTAECSSDGDIFVIKSLYYTYAQFCSPCAPGACYLMNPLDTKEGNNKCYCFGHDWFDNGKAPYPVYSVETDEEVQPE